MMSPTRFLVSSVFIAAALVVLDEISVAAAARDRDVVTDRRALKSNRFRHRRLKSRRHGNVTVDDGPPATVAEDWMEMTKSTRRINRVRHRAAAFDNDVVLTDDSRARCVNIPDEFVACRSLLGYRQMRTPDLVRTAYDDGVLSSVGRDVIGKWIKDTLSPSGAAASRRDAAGLPTCSPVVGLLVCTLVSPVCLEMPVWPCRSLCERARRDCSANGVGRGLRWPEAVDCSWLPNDDQLCIGRNETTSGINDTNTISITEVGPPTEMTETTTTMTTTGDVMKTVAASAMSERRNAMQLLQMANNVSYNSADSYPVCVHPDCVRPEAASDTLLDNYCTADFVAKIRPDRYVTTGSDVKIMASKSVKFYKYPSSPSSNPSNQRTKWIFHIGRTSITNCSCDTRRPTQADSDQPAADGENFIVMGRLDRPGDRGRRGEHQHKPRLELTAIAVFDARSKEFRRALRAIKDADACGGPVGRRAPAGPPTSMKAPRMWTNDDRGTWRKGDQRRQQHAALSATDLGIVSDGGSERKLMRLEKKLRKRAERMRARKEGRRTVDESARVDVDNVQRVDDDDDNNRLQRLQPSSQPAPRQHRQSRVQQQQQPADEETIMANRRDRIERRKSTASPVFQRNTSRRNRKNDRVARTDAL